MKNQRVFLIVFLGLLVLTLVLIITGRGDVTNVYCGKSPETQYNCGQQSPVPANRSRALRKGTVLYYNISDTCNFQTLQLETYKGFLHTNIGRFKSKKLNDEYYRIDKLEAKHYAIKDTSVVPKFAIKRILVNKNTTENHLIFQLTFEKDSILSNSIDYVYGGDNGFHEPPILIKKDATIEFRGAIRPDKNWGGYECDGKAITSQ